MAVVERMVRMLCQDACPESGLCSSRCGAGHSTTCKFIGGSSSVVFAGLPYVDRKLARFHVLVVFVQMSLYTRPMLF